MNQASTVDELVAQYNDGLRSIIDKHAPLREKVVVLRPSAPWFTSEAHTLRRKLRKAERLWRKRRRVLFIICLFKRVLSIPENGEENILQQQGVGVRW